MPRTLVALALAATLAACTAPDDLAEHADLGGDGETITLDDSKADAAATAGEIRVRADGLTVWMRPTAEPATRDGRTVWVLRGRASKNLESVFPFVADDGFAQASVLSARTFEIVLDGGSELNSMLSGLRLFLRLDVAGTDTTYFATFLMAPRFAGFQGSSGLYLRAALAPIAVGQELVYRGLVRGPSSSTATLAVSTPDGDVPPVGLRAPSTFNVDFRFEPLARAAAPASDRVTFTLGALHKRAGVAMALTQVGLTTADPYETWPHGGGCTPEAQACLDALPDGVVDTEACGTYREVITCALPFVPPSIAPTPDDMSAVDAVVAAARATLPADRTITAKGFVVTGNSSASPGVARVLAALQGYLGLDASANLGEVPRAELDAALAAAGAPGLVAAAQQTVFATDFGVGLLRDVRVVDGQPRTTRVYVLYFPTAFRAIVVTLTSPA